MATRIARALDDDERLLVEAGTGTGKTLAYLVPAILSGKKVIVSTATKTLQDQIARVDLPRLEKLMPEPFTWAVMKGLVVTDFEHRRPVFEAAVAEGLRTGRICFREDRAQGIAATGGHFARLMRGENVGKSLVVLGPE